MFRILSLRSSCGLGTSQSQRPRRAHGAKSANRHLGVESLERRELLSGVTLIAHGFNSDAEGWVTAMAQAIGARAEVPADQVIYRWDVTDPGHDGGPLSISSVKLSGLAPNDPGTADPEIAVLVNWSDVAGKILGNYTRSSGDVAAAVADQLLSSGFLAELGQPLANLPLHLIGHSRGGSVVGAMTEKLGQRGIWVEQVTTLDPHPVDGINDPFGFDFGDAPMVAWENVVYWDNYWRENDDLFDFVGEPIPNVHDVHLSDDVLADGGYSYEHSDVHLWYYGTIDTSVTPPANNGDEDVPSDWYGGDNPDRLTSGYAYSRLVGGTRARDGLTEQYAGGLAQRQAVALTQPAWPNVLDLQVTGAVTTFVDGAPIPVGYYQLDADSAVVVRLGVDTDRNPFNANHQMILQHQTTSAASLQADSAELSTTNVPSGTYYVFATAEDADGHVRYAYAPTAVIVDNRSVNLPPTDIQLDATVALENVTDYRIGRVTVVDPNEGDTHTLTVSDNRFEIVDGYLKLKSDQSLSIAAGAEVELDITATDGGQLSLDPPRHFVVTVLANPLPWHHVAKPLDVEGDGSVSPIDALRVINELNSRRYTDSFGALPTTRPDSVVSYLDVNADGFVTPIDALRVINHLNQGGEGESIDAVSRNRQAMAQGVVWEYFLDSERSDFYSRTSVACATWAVVQWPPCFR